MGRSGSSLIGMNVAHQKYGDGIITEFDGKRIHVEFHDSTSCWFLYPSIFHSAKLQAKDSLAESVVLRDIKSHICDHCNQFYDEITNSGVLHLCNECSKKYIECKSCKKRFFCENDSLTNPLCDKCHKKRYFVCSVCGKEYLNASKLKSPYVKDRDNICLSCAEDKYYRCKKCGVACEEKYVHLVHFAADMYNGLCPRCEEKYLGKCTKCGKEFILQKTNLKEQFCSSCSRTLKYHRYLDSLDISKYKCESITLNELKKMRTRLLMSRLKHCMFSFPEHFNHNVEHFDCLIIKDYDTDYLVIYNLPDEFKGISRAGYTMTELKKEGWSILLEINKSPIYYSAFNDKISFLDVPIDIYAQTFDDMNYGNIWHGDDLVEEGNQYGDTSTFYLIGIIEHTRV